MKLSREQHDLLRRAADSAGMSFRPGYSGRGMFGDACVGVAGSHIEFARFLVSVTIADNDMGHLLAEACTDDMGLGTIWYWPEIEA